MYETRRIELQELDKQIAESSKQLIEALDKKKSNRSPQARATTTCSR